MDRHGTLQTTITAITAQTSSTPCLLFKKNDVSGSMDPYRDQNRAVVHSLAARIIAFALRLTWPTGNPAPAGYVLQSHAGSGSRHTRSENQLR